MNTILYIITIFLSIATAYALKKLFTRLGKFDAINYRSVHDTKATKTGGIAVFTTLFLMSTYLYISKEELFDFSLLIPLGIMFIVGVYDDFYNADFKLKFFLQISTYFFGHEYCHLLSFSSYKANKSLYI